MMKEIVRLIAATAVALSVHAAVWPAHAQVVAPVWSNDTSSGNIYFNDTFGHSVIIGSYNSSSGVWSAMGVAGGFSTLTVSGNATIAGTLGVTGLTSVVNLTATGTVSGTGITALFASPPAIGSTLPAAGTFSTLSVTGAVTGSAFTSLISAPPVGVGSVTPASGAFTTISASGTVSGLGFSNYLLAPPPIGSTTPNGGAFTTLSASGAVSGVGFSNYLLSPPQIGVTTPNTGKFSATTVTGNETVNGIFNNSGGAGYATTTIDNTNDFLNGILVNGATSGSTASVLNQELTQSPIQVTWHPGYTGTIASPFTTAGLQVVVTSTKTDPVYPWGIIGQVKNFTDVLTPIGASSNPNAVAVNGTVFPQTVTSSQASSSWGGNFVCNESNAAAITNPTHYCFGSELDVQEPTGSGTDSNSKRIGLFIGAGPMALDTTIHIFAGIDIGTNGTIDNGITFFPLSATGNITNLINAGLTGTHYTNLLTGVGLNIDNKGNISSSGYVQTVGIAFASLPTCNAGTTGARVWVSDNNTGIAYRAVVTGGGTTPVPAICNGGTSQWIMD